MKLKDWAEKQGISYLTAWRWFKAKDPRLADAYQSDSGTIIVPDVSNTLEPTMSTPSSNDVMSSVLKKTVELSKNNASVEDFAAWILSNFSLKPNTVSENPKYSRNKPKTEDVQSHFKKFIPPKGEKPKPNMFVAEADVMDDLVAKSNDLTAQELVDEIQKIGSDANVSVNPSDVPEVGELYKDISSALYAPRDGDLNVTTYENVAEGVVTRSVDLTPQQLNYTGSTSSAFSNSSNCISGDMGGGLGGTIFNNSIYSVSSPIMTGAFKPTQKEIDSVSKAFAPADKPKRGRKPSKITGNK